MVLDAVTIWVSQLNVPIITTLAQLIDNDIIYVAIILFLAVTGEKGKKRNRLILSLVLIYLVGFGLKYAVQEIRPCIIIPSKVECPNSYSFPSNHAVVAFALAAGLWKKPNGWLYTVFAIFVGFTRIYLGVHTLIDVIGGAVVGALGLYVLDTVWERAPKKIRTHLQDYLD